MNIATFRRVALSLPFAEEGSHMDHPDFRIRGKIFASLSPAPAAQASKTPGGQTPGGQASRPPTTAPVEHLGMAKLTPAQQAEFIRSHPAAFFPCQGAWGDRGATYIRLAKIDRPTLLLALQAAWRNTAPAALLKELGPDAPPP